MSNYEKIVPKGALILHTPWVEIDGSFVGRIEDYPSLIQCTFENEQANLTPVVVDSFISWVENSGTYELPVFDDISYPNYSRHTHDAGHDHHFSDVAFDGGMISIDDNNSDNPISVSAEYHSHDVTLGWTYLRTRFQDDQDQPIVFEPKHYEVNAYWAIPEVEPKEGIPVGTFALYLGDNEFFNRWRNVATRSRNRGEPSRWIDVFVKVVGCWPSQRAKGSNEHIHVDLGHSHPSGSAGSSSGVSRIDNSSGDGRVARSAHSHEITEAGISDSTTNSCAPGDSRPYHIGARLYVAEDERAVWQRGMIIPFVPRDRDAFRSPPENWRILDRPTSDEAFELFFSLVPAEVAVGDFTSGNIRNKTHSHHFYHGHSVVLESTGGQLRNEDSSEVRCAKGSHKHEAVLFDREPQKLSDAPNIIPNRKVVFLEYIGP